MACVFLWQISLSIMLSRSSYTVTKGKKFFFTAEQYSIVKMSHSCFMHSSTDGHMGYFHILVIINNAAMNTGVFIFFQISVFGFIRYIPKSGITGSKGKSTFNFLRLCPYYFPQWLQQSAFPPTVQKCSLFSISLPALVIC